MPRNVTVTFSDGSTHVYQNAPDDITPAQVQARAEQEFNKTVKALDGGRGPAPRPAPKAPAAQANVDRSPKPGVDATEIRPGETERQYWVRQRPQGDDSFLPSLRRGLPRGVLPAGGGMAGFGGGAALGVPIAPLFGPAAPVVPFVTGLIGALGGSAGASYLQEKALDALPETVTAPIGQDAKTRAKDRSAHPYATMIGESAPSFLFGRPALGGIRVAEGSAPTAARILANPAATPVVSAALAGSINAGTQLATEGKVDPTKVAIAAGIGALQGKNTRLGNVFAGAGSKAGDWTAGLFGWQRQAAEGMAGRFEQQHGDAGRKFYDPEAPPVPDKPEAGFSNVAHPEGEILSADGSTPVRFATHREAAVYATRHQLGGEYDIAIVDGWIVLKRRTGVAPSTAPSRDTTQDPVAGTVPSTVTEPVARTMAPESAPAAPQQAPVSSPSVEPAGAPEPAPSFLPEDGWKTKTLESGSTRHARDDENGRRVVLRNQNGDVVKDITIADYNAFDLEGDPWLLRVETDNITGDVRLMDPNTGRGLSPLTAMVQNGVPIEEAIRRVTAPDDSPLPTRAVGSEKFGIGANRTQSSTVQAGIDAVAPKVNPWVGPDGKFRIPSPDETAAFYGASTAPDGEAPLAPPTQIGAKTVARVPATKDKVDLQFEVHDMSNIRQAEGELQNRDRTRPETQAFLSEFTQKFDPELLGEDKFTDRGAPIINKDNVILSGNGRMMGMEDIYAGHPEKAEAYRQFLRDEGYNVDGIERPILVRRLLNNLHERSFVTGSNDPDVAALSPPEQARQDATDILTPDIVAKYKGGDLTAARNDSFITSFLGKLSGKQRRSLMDDKGKVSAQALDRINNALLYSAYGNAGEVSRTFISKVMERTDDDSKTLTGALTEAAPQWIGFQNAIKSGEIDPKYDITGDLLKAIAKVSDIKAGGNSVGGYLRMDDMVSPIDPFVKDLLLSFHNNKITRFKSKQAIAEMLRSYIDRAGKQQAGEDMFGQAETPSAHDLWRSIDKEAQGGDEATLLDAETQPTGRRPKGRKLKDEVLLEDANEGPNPSLARLSDEALRQRIKIQRMMAEDSQAFGEPDLAARALATAAEAEAELARRENSSNRTVAKSSEAVEKTSSGPKDFIPAPRGDTRGRGVQYHGARGEVANLSEGYSNPNNIYGGFETFYTTDAYDIASGYQRKNANGRVYQVAEREPVKTFDMEKRMSPQEAGALFGVDYDKDHGFVPSAIEEAVSNPEGRESDGTVNLREVMDELRAGSAAEGYSKSDVQEFFDAAITNLIEQGYGAMSHIGGLRTGNEPHYVKIYFKAHDQIELKEIGNDTSGKTSGDEGRDLGPAEEARGGREVGEGREQGDAEVRDEGGRGAVDYPVANTSGEMTPEWEAHLDEVEAKADAIRARGETPIFHATAGARSEVNPNGMGMTFYAENLMDAARYAGAGGGRRNIGNVGRVEVMSLPDGANLLDITTDAGLRVFASLPVEGRISGIIIQDAQKDLAAGENIRASNQFWTMTKRVSGSDAAGIKQNIVDALRERGYDGIRFMDDRHTTIALFDEVALEDRRETTPENERGKYATTFDEASFTNRRSIHDSAIIATGLTKEQFETLPPERQAKLLKDQLEKRYALKVNIANDLPLRLAIDQILDAHQTLAGMAQVLGISERAIGFDGKLTITLQKKGRFLGAYYPGTHEIKLPGRTNSFGHEWGHALDFYIAKELGAADVNGGLSGLIRAGDANEIPGSVTDAAINLMRVMFHDKALEASRLLTLEKQLENSKSLKRKAEIQAQIDNILKGASKSPATRSAYYGNALTADKGQEGYWTKPTEMFARAWEAYVAHKMAEAGLSSEFVTKGNASYLSDAGERFAKTFPKGEDRAAIFGAFDELMGEVTKASLLEGSSVYADPNIKEDLAGVEGGDRLAEHLEKETSSLARKTAHLLSGAADIESIKAWWHNLGVDFEKYRQVYPGLKPAALTVGHNLDNLRRYVFSAMSDNVRAIANRWNSSAVHELADIFGFDYTGKRAVGRVWDRSIEIRQNRHYDPLEKALRGTQFAGGAGPVKFLKKLTLEQEKILTDMIEKGANMAPNDLDPKLRDDLAAIATVIRQEQDKAWYELRNALKKDAKNPNEELIGYIKDVGYLRQRYAVPKIVKSGETRQAFLDAVTENYRMLFDKEYPDADAIVGDDEALQKFMAMAGGHNVDGSKELSKLNSQIRKLEKAQATSDDPDAIAAKLEQLYAQQAEMVGEIMDAVRDAQATAQAIAHVHAVIDGRNFSNISPGNPDGNFLKSRVFTPQGRELLRPFYISNPVEAFVDYIASASRRTEWIQRFGKDNAKLNALLDRMTAEGVPARDKEFVKDMFDKMTGRYNRTGIFANPTVINFLSMMRARGVATMLTRAVTVSMAEAAIEGVQTGSAAKGMMALVRSYSTMLGTQGGRARMQAARAQGLIVGHLMSGFVFQDRWGQTAGHPLTRWDKLAMNVINKTGLGYVTEAQIASAAVAGGHLQLLDLAEDFLAGGDDATRAAKRLNELGISDHQAFAKAMVEWGPSQGDYDAMREFMGDKMFEAYITAVDRFARLVIQEPTTSERPAAALNPAASYSTHSITAFMVQSFRNISARFLKIMADHIGTGDWAAAGKWLAGVAGAYAVAFMGQLFFTWQREEVMNHSRAREWEREGVYWRKMAQLAAQRSFAFGWADKAINMKTGLQWNRPWYWEVFGAYMGNDMDNIQKGFFSPKSDKTNTGNYNQTKARYNMFAAPIVSYLAGIAPGGTYLTPMAGAGAAYLTSRSMGDNVSTWFNGPKGAKTDPETGELIETPEETKARLDAKAERKKEREAAKAEAAGQ